MPGELLATLDFFKNILLNYKKGQWINLFLITNLVILMAAAARHATMSSTDAAQPAIVFYDIYI